MSRIICFHNPDENYGFLSNWYLSDFVIDGRKYTSMERYMMSEKARLFDDAAAESQIMATDNVGKIKALGRSVQGYNDLFWSGFRQLIVYRGLMAKFSQNEILKANLFDTYNYILAECAVQDKIWGIGLSIKDEQRLDPSQWQGQNLLGFTLMDVRKALQVEKNAL